MGGFIRCKLGVSNFMAYTSHIWRKKSKEIFQFLLILEKKKKKKNYQVKLYIRFVFYKNFNVLKGSLWCYVGPHLLQCWAAGWTPLVYSVDINIKFRFDVFIIDFWAGTFTKFGNTHTNRHFDNLFLLKVFSVNSWRYIEKGGPYFGYFRIFTQAGAHMVRNK